MSWFSKNKKEIDFGDLELSITTLFIHAARLDENYSLDEKKIITKCLTKLGFGDQNEISELIKQCEILEEEGNQILHLTQQIKKLEYSERLKIVEMLVEVMYADKKIDEFEDNLIRRVSGLVYIENVDLGIIRENTKKKLNL